MQAFQAAAAVCSLACVCAEVITLLVGPGWPCRCIKALAGLYILVVLLRAVPDMRGEMKKMLPAAQQPVSLQSAEDQILVQTQTQLEEKLEAECQKKFGLSAKIEVCLEQTEQKVYAARVMATLPPGSSAAQVQKLSDCLEQKLGVKPTIRTGEDTG